MPIKTVTDKNPLVSIITPSYNGEDFVHRFLDSILKQTYRNMELIFINDGSTDRTEEIVLSYKSKFEKLDISFKYIYQENKGQAAAVNQGLKIFKGDYLTWPDSDDILHEDNIKNKVAFLEANKGFGMVLCKSRILDEVTLKQIGVLERVPPRKEDYLFDDLILEKNIYFTPGGYMIRKSSFLDVKPDRTIYESRAGQNWQILLPMAYKYRCGYIDEYLYDYLIRVDSHSRQEISYDDVLGKSYNHEQLLKRVIKEMQIKEEKYYLNLIEQKYAKKRLKIAYQFKDRKQLEERYENLKDKQWVDRRDSIVYLRGKFKMFDFLCVVMAFPLKVGRKLKRLNYDR